MMKKLGMGRRTDVLYMSISWVVELRIEFFGRDVNANPI
jgi:hypothetical protein